MILLRWPVFDLNERQVNRINSLGSGNVCLKDQHWHYIPLISGEGVSGLLTPAGIIKSGRLPSISVSGADQRTRALCRHCAHLQRILLSQFENPSLGLVTLSRAQCSEVVIIISISDARVRTQLGARRPGRAVRAPRHGRDRGLRQGEGRHPPPHRAQGGCHRNRRKRDGGKQLEI